MATINYVYCAIDEHGVIHEIKTSLTQARPSYYFRMESKGTAAIQKHNALFGEHLRIARFKMILDDDSEIEELTEHNIQATITQKANEKCITVINKMKGEICNPQNILYKDFDFATKKHFGVIRDDVISRLLEKYLNEVTT